MNLEPAQTPNFKWAEPNKLNWVHEKIGVWISLKSDHLKLERFNRSFRLAQAGISALERLWFRYRLFHEQNLMYKLLKRIWQAVYTLAKYLRYFDVLWFKLNKLRRIKFDVWINRCSFVNLGRFKYVLSSAQEKLGIWTGPYRDLQCFLVTLSVTFYQDMPLQMSHS